MKTIIQNPYVLICILPVMALIAYYSAINSGLVMLMSFLIMTGLLAFFVYRFNLQVVLLKTIAFTLPFSLEIPFFPGTMIRFPGEILLFIAALVLIMEMLRQPIKEFMDPLHREILWIMPLVLAFGITLPFSEMLFVSVKFSFVNILYISVFFVFLARHLRRNSGLFGQLLVLYGAGMIVVALWGFYRLWQWDFNPVVMRGIFHPFYNDHTIFGASAAVLAAVFFVSGFDKNHLTNRLLLWLLSMVFLSLVIFSTSRGAILSVFFTILVVAMMYARLRVMHMFSILIILAGFALVFQGSIEDRLNRVNSLSYDAHADFLERKESVANITTDVSNLERFNRWVSAISMFKEKPLTGFGPGTYQFAYIPFQQPQLMNRISVTNPWEPPEGSGGTAHSEYLLALSEMGIWGLLGWLILLGRWVYIAFEKSLKHPRRWIIAAAFAGLSTYIFHANFNNFLTTDKFAFLFWGTAAWLITNLYETENKPEILPAD